MNRLQGKTALVTAAAAGMGRAAALAFAREGAKVIATDVNEKLLAEISGTPNITTRPLDVLSDAAVTAFVNDVGAVDILFNCAGWVHHGTILECEPKDWDRSFNLNVRSMYTVIRAMLPKMIAKGGGVILNMASVLGGEKAAPNRLAYAASKAAVAGFTRALAADHVKQNIRVNCVCPGTVDTPSLGDRINAFADPAQARKDFIARQPMGRLATAEEIAETFVYLVSDESSFMTGQAVFVDGGMSL
ncbi:SDR family oxidoreductase [Usitatibacter palustris]|uniref:2-keto-3-deoxy-L-fuconate dehydrogenase n=1 Tax=Usitatibacter palustris TaxID=2732487 RepID=A0A6M4H570_9PROT|nr:SDR family oxidoreductase [Usitatibacter palustris]QJR14799.1 2-keto-3-deoxy-L-fuconate dehydrogenase [Usitatibacter palustris]